MKYNPRQQEAILHKEGPAIVVAGPGSGKTAVLTQRTCHMIRTLRIPPEKIMVITFTRAAAEEMRARFRAFPDMSDAPVYFATFHASFYRILRNAEGLTTGSVLGQDEKYRWLRALLRAEKQEMLQGDERLAELSGEIARVKSAGLPLTTYQAKCCETTLFIRLFQEYEEQLKSSGKVDYEDMLLRTRRLLLEKPHVLRFWREKYPYILVDEFQDINRSQYEIVKLLAEPGRNLFVVGDDDQSIYRFRGAAPGIMQQFVADYPEAVRYELFGCYRCSPEILKAAERLISNNTVRFPKQLVSYGNKGKRPEVQRFADGAAEREGLLKAVQALHRKGIPYGRMAVLCRTGFALQAYRSLLNRSEIPCCSPDSGEGLYKRQAARDMFAYFELASGNLKRNYFLQVMNRPLRYLPRAAAASDPVDLRQYLSALSGHPFQFDAAERFLYQLACLKKLRPFAALTFIRHEIGYDAWIKAQSDTREIYEEAMETLDILQEESAGFSSYSEWRSYIEKVEKEKREEQEKGSRKSRDAAPEKDALVLHTMHGAKGLEFDAVFLPDVNEGNIPHKRSLSKEALEEERRLFYVAITRARQYLWIGWVRKNRAGICEPSRFLREL